FPFDSVPVSSAVNGLALASSLHQYLCISTGEPICPHFFAYPHWKSRQDLNPFSRHAPFLTNCLTLDIMRQGKIAAGIGNRSIMTHTAFPATLTVECHCLSLHHYGTLEVLW
ncbi:MAG: hypothetical protein RRA35_14035, partial [Desulfomonilia bacterium]|nr:hypothetical protein [Desulfomonilia bacterium]